VVLVAMLMNGGWSQDAAVAPSNAVPAMLKDVGIDQKLDAQLPLELGFRDEAGRDVRLGDYFNHGRPVILTLVYYNCPSLCTMVLNDLTRAMNVLSETAGKDFDVVTVSFNPDETAELASAKKRQYLNAYRRAGAEAGWHFLTGNAASIKALTDAVGFRYAFDAKTQQYVHASGIMVTTPGGKLARYFYGLEYSPRDLRLAFIDAQQGKSAASAKVLFYCFQYDPVAGRYSLAVVRLLRVAAGVTIVGVGSLLLMMSRKGRARTTGVMQK